jgi:RNA polymerase sigma-70 factor (ECF subfamily)
VELALREAWWPAVAAVARLVGDLGVAEDAAQEACTQALEQWPRDGMPTYPTGWIVAVARRRALDYIRRESTRHHKERLSVEGWTVPTTPDTFSTVAGDDQLALLFACCHPALDANVGVTLTLRIVSGLPTASIARLLLMPEPTVAQRIVRAKRKIRDAGIRLRVPSEEDLPARLDAVLRVIYLAYTEGHYPTGTDAIVRVDLCDEAQRLARALHRLMPSDSEVAGLLGLILLTSARAAARVGDAGQLVGLPDQDRGRWDPDLVAEGKALVVQALSRRQPGRYQLQAAIAACHAEAMTADDTDWRQIAALYGELLTFDPSPVIEANRAVAVAYAEGAAAGLTILDTLAASSELARWPQLHVARGGLLAQAGRADDAITAYRDALALEPPSAARQFLTARIAALRASDSLTENP